MTEKISIIGCGWLGFPLAKHLISKGYQTKGSTTSVEKVQLLRLHGIDAFVLEITEKGIKGPVENCLSESHCLILNIPPGVRKDASIDYVKRIEFLIPHIEASNINHVIFIGSTSIFADDEAIPVITEETLPNPESEAGHQLLTVEKMLKRNQNFRTTILRFSGLFGEDRHPATYLSGKSNIPNPNAPVNLVHLKDCIDIISNIIEKNVFGEIFNVASPSHPTRKDYYTSICNKMDMPPPEFDASKNKGKRISSDKLVQLLDYEFLVKLNN